jgi:hypothetical protein
MHDTPSEERCSAPTRALPFLRLRARAERPRTGQRGCWIDRLRTEPKSASTRPSAPASAIDAKLQAPVPLYLTYVTAWATQDGVVHFRDDIYQRDLGDAVAMNTAVVGGSEEAFYQLPQ